MSYERPRGAACCAISPRPAKAQTVRASLLAAGTAALLLSAAMPALADSGRADVEWHNHPSIIVASDGSEYTQVLASSHSVEGQIRVELDAELTGRVLSYHAWPRLGIPGENFYASWHAFKDNGQSKSYSTPRPRSVNETFNFSIPRQDYTEFMIVACNLQADRLRSQGMSNSQVFSQNRIVDIFVSSSLDYEMSGPDRLNPPPEEVQSDSYIKLICQRDDSLDPPAQGPVAGAALLVQTAQVNKLTGACELRLQGTISSQDPNQQVKFRYVDAGGQQSDIKTETTDANGLANFTHSYPLAKGIKSGRIQIVGQSNAFLSNWADFESDCSAPTQDIKTVLPPKAAGFTFMVREEVEHRGLYCPSEVVAVGNLEGRGTASGAVSLFAGGLLKALKPYSLEDGEDFFIVGQHNLSWGPTQAQQNAKFAMNVTNLSGEIVDSLEHTENFVCRQPQVSDAHQGAPGDLATEIPAPKSVNLLVSELGKKTKNGHVCPEKGRISAFVQSDAKGFTGTLAIFAGGSLQQEIDIDLPANHGTSFPYDYELPWNGSTIPSQTVIFSMKVWNQHRVEVASLEKTGDFDCTEIKTTGVAMPGGGLTTEQPGPQSSQQTRPATVGQLAVGPALAIMAPKGTVRRGEIRLTGGPANATYELTFYRKVYSSYQKVSGAGLPNQMTGLSASFELGALDGARQWRLEVCPVMGGQGSCKTSDFRVPVIGKTKQQAPVQGTPFVIVPGAIPQN
jgi:hypothetical protein